MSNPTPSDIAQAVVDQVLARDAHGQRKYGVTLDRTDLSTSDWLQHMAEEMMDGAHYALAAKREIQRTRDADAEQLRKAFNYACDITSQVMSPADAQVANRALHLFWNKLHDHS